MRHGFRICILRQSWCAERIAYSKVFSIGLLQFSIRHYHPEFRRNDFVALDYDRAVQMLIRARVFAIVSGNFVRNKVNSRNIIFCDRESISPCDRISLLIFVKLIFSTFFISIENFIPNIRASANLACFLAFFIYNQFSIRIALNILARREGVFVVFAYPRIARNIHYGSAISDFAPLVGFIGFRIRCRSLQMANRCVFMHVNREGFAGGFAIVAPCVRNCYSARFLAGHGCCVTFIVL